MPRIFDNIDLSLLPALQNTLDVSERADFCVGYFNLRGWKSLADYVDEWSGGDSACCRILIGMQTAPRELVRQVMQPGGGEKDIDNNTASKLKKQLAEEFRQQLTYGVPTNEDEKALQKLAHQIETGRVKVKLFLRHRLHAKVYVLFRNDAINPIVGYLGSSNLTFSGLSHQGELNVDVLDNDACNKLAQWFEDRWKDRWCVDISDELIDILRESWAREDLVPPYHIYLKIAYHLSQEARTGLDEFQIPADFGDRLFDFQKAAVKIAAHHLNRRGGVLLGDVTGLGKTLMATALARIFEDDFGFSTLILCPKNLVPMWKDYSREYRMHGPKVLSTSLAIRDLPDLRRYRLVIIDESHNLRNREGKRYRAIREYIRENDSKCILLSATPYNKSYLDLSNQLRLFMDEEEDLGIRPDNLIRDIGEVEFMRRHQCPVRSLAAFEHSEFPDDWRELMRLFLVRRTRTFVKENYAKEDQNGRKYLLVENGDRAYFPERIPKTAGFKADKSDPTDTYAQFFSDEVVDTVNDLSLPRYGVGNYVKESPEPSPNDDEKRIICNLSKAGPRLKGFCRTNLFKRLESSGYAFLQSVARHILRNHVYLHALKTGNPVPIGTQDAAFLDPARYDQDRDIGAGEEGDEDMDGQESQDIPRTWQGYEDLAERIYGQYRSQQRNRFDWLRSDLFTRELADDLRADARALFSIIDQYGDWDPDNDAKLNRLHELLSGEHGGSKVLVFTQFADTVSYLEENLQERGLSRLAGVTGSSDDPTKLAYRFSPESNNKDIPPEEQLRVLVATDVLSEGQNLQDCNIVVNFDLPWALVRLVQRAGRVDRIGQDAPSVWCYSFMPADGVEEIINLRSRVVTRLHENGEVLGADEQFFEGEGERQIVDLFHEKSGILDDDPDSEVDLASRAYQIWHNAIEDDPALKKEVTNLPAVVYGTRPHQPTEETPEGVLAYMKTALGTDALSWVDTDGNVVSESQIEILRAAQCEPGTPALPRTEKHHAMVRKAVKAAARQEKSVGGQLGSPRSARFRVYERLKEYLDEVEDTLFEPAQLRKALEHVYRHPLRQAATDTLNRQLRSGIDDDGLARLVVDLYEEERLCVAEDEERERREPQIICSMGLTQNDQED